MHTFAGPLRPFTLKKFPFVTASEQVGWVESKLKYFTISLDTAETGMSARLLPIAFDAGPRESSPSRVQASGADSTAPDAQAGPHAAATAAATSKGDSPAPNSKAMQYYYIGLRRAATPGASGSTSELSVDCTEAWYGFAQSVLDFQNKNSNMDILIRSITRQHVPSHVSHLSNMKTWNVHSL